MIAPSYHIASTVSIMLTMRQSNRSVASRASISLSGVSVDRRQLNPQAVFTTGLATTHTHTHRIVTQLDPLALYLSCARTTGGESAPYFIRVTYVITINVPLRPAAVSCVFTNLVMFQYQAMWKCILNSCRLIYDI